ncbi:MAG: hypothetical protein PUB43_05805 [Oscillospiraceae bacterium]|nr:hypothetical protein [Oscillospiraceae bacterium]
MHDLKKRKSVKLTGFLMILAAVALLWTASFQAFSADSAFEKSISAFPESYKPYLRQLHELYPNWTFEAFKTGLDWTTVINNEVGDKSLVEHSSSSENLKSKESGDYNSSTGQYIYKDGGFVTANRLAVEYFMDPRNFLNEEGIFQFENLSFHDSFTVTDVEAVLKGTFMADTLISYYDAAGILIKTDKKYAEVIYEAGKTYNVNPCYLASKIRNEVGADGSASVSGKHSTYPGIYNFYNIGATDGEGAIARGLQWASTGSSYMRPWNTPYKSIMGGAQFIAETYISIGQFTGYLQRFNVNPKCTKPLYTHQYMTNLTGALSQGYTNYSAYAKMGKLGDKFVFSIPVFENMPSTDKDNEKASNADSAVQFAKISADYCYVRTGPSTNNARVTDSNGVNIQLANGTAVEILSKGFTDSKYYGNMLKYPHWVQIAFTYGGVNYTGFVPEDFVAYSTYISVGLGEYKLTYHKGVNTNLNIISSSSSIAKVVSPDTVNFLKAGTVYLTVFDSTGRYDIVKYVVSNTGASTAVPSAVAAQGTASLKLTAGAVSGALKYSFALSDRAGNIVAKGETSDTAYTFYKLSTASRYTLSVRPLLASGSSLKYGTSASVTCHTKPLPVTNAAIEYTASGAKITWTKVQACTGYCVYGYNAAKNAYTRLAIVSDQYNYANIAAADLIYDSYVVRAYAKDADTKAVYGALSEPLELSDDLMPPTDFRVTGISQKSASLAWNKTPRAEKYIVYLCGDSDYKELVTTDKCEVSIGGLEAMTVYTFAVKAVKGSGADEVSSELSEPLSLRTEYPIPEGFAQKDTGASGYTLTWNRITKAAGYNIYRKNGEEYEKIAYVKTPSYTASDLGYSAVDYYMVTAVVNDAGTLCEGEFSEEICAATLPAKVTGFKASVTDTSVSLTWDSVKNATCYNVFVYKNGTYAFIKTVYGNQFTDSGLKPGTSYKYAVKPYIKAGTCTTKGATTYVSFVTKPQTVLSASVSDPTNTSHKVTWKAASGANYYYVYRYSDEKSAYVLLASTSGTSYSASGLTAGKTYYYKIVSAVVSGGKVLAKGATSQTFKFCTTPLKVTNLTAAGVSSSAVKLTWNKVSGATGYQIYRYDSSKGDYVRVATVTGNSYTASPLSSKMTFRFKVRAVRVVNNKTYYGYFSSTLSVKTK